MRSTSLILPAVFVSLPGTLRAGEPTVRNVSMRGLQIGGTTTLIVYGDDLGTAPRLLLPFPADQKLKPGSTKVQATFDVTLDGNAEPGYHHLRVVTDDGVSAPVVIAVDRLPQRPVTAAVEQLPVALHGTVGGSAAVESRFSRKAAPKVLVEVQAQRP